MPRPSKLGVKGLRKRSDGRFEIDLVWKDKRGVQQRWGELLPVGTQAKAARARAEGLLAQSVAGTLRPKGDRTPTTLRPALEEFSRLCPTANPADRARKCAALLAKIGDVPLESIDELAVENSKAVRAAEGKKSSTINRELAALKTMFSRAVEWGWLDPDRRPPKIRLLKEPAARVRWLTDVEMQKLQAVLPPRFKRLVLACALSGQRLGNVAKLRRDCVDFEHHTARFVIRKSGTEAEKTHVIPLSPALEHVILEGIQDGDRLAKKTGKPTPDVVFVSRFVAPYTSSGATASMRNAVKRAGLNDLHLHDLRHHYATTLRRAGHGLDIVQALLGHAKIATTQRYAHIGRSELVDAMGAAAAAWTSSNASE